MACWLLAGLASPAAEITNSPAASATNAPPASAPATNAPSFPVKGYELIGNTVLPPALTDPILGKYTGPTITFADIRQALSDLQMAYRQRGYVTVAVSLPPQQLTNGIVKVQVTEGRLAQITIVGNRFFTSNNVMRELPGLHTNILLNALEFQQELDHANANRDRQVYPVLSPGAEPGTTDLELKVKDRLPLHIHTDLNNYFTPHTPELRANFALVDNNLWQLDHQVGVQYSFTPEVQKQGDYNFYDQPLIANYSAYYRLPLSGVNGSLHQHEYAPGEFGYDEATRRFRPPPASGTAELVVYASRSSSDTGPQQQSQTLIPPQIPPGGTLQIRDQVVNQTLNPNEDLGLRLSQPLPQVGRFSSSIAAGLDFKNYRSTLIQTRTFQASLFIPSQNPTNGPPFDEFSSPPVSTERTVFTSVQYLPLALSWEGSATDAHGVTSLSVGQSFNWTWFLDNKKHFQAVAGSPNANGDYYVLTAAMTRDQKVYHDWGIRLHADGQWANEPLISNEQFSFGGQAGVRGYLDGAEYGDTGWRLQFEPHSPYFNLGLAFDRAPIVARYYGFMDYGERYLLDPQGRDNTINEWGVGAGLDASIGEHFDFRVAMALPLLRIPGEDSGHLRITFSLGAQW